MKNRKTVGSLLGIMLALVVSHSGATTLTISDVVGTWDPASPYNNSTETATAANWLVAWYNDEGLNPNPNPQSVFLLNPLGPTKPLPSPLITSGRQDVTADAPLPASFSALYVSAKYGNFGVLFYGGNYTSYELPSTWVTGLKKNGDPQVNGISHWQTFGSQVPDHGMTVSMIGLALAALAFWRNRVR